jgi:hypothetical protein
MDEITSTVVLPVTEAQMTAFSAWIKNTYVTYEGVMGAIKSPAIDTYIKTHILPDEMNTVLRRSERFRGEKWGDITIQTLLLYRRRVTAKMNNLKGKIVSMTFPIEAAQARRVNLAAALSRRQHRDAANLRYQQERQAYLDHMNDTYEDRSREIEDRREAMEQAKIKRSTIVTLLDVEAFMDDDCAICLQSHKMTEACTINCGHQFGNVCFSKWKKDTCPLCRTKVTETTIYAAPIINDVVALDVIVA